MKYTITQYDEWVVPRHSITSSSKHMCNHRYVDEYSTDDIDMAKDLIKEMLDAPLAELTLDEIQKDFSDIYDSDLSESTLVSIMNYYNGRLGLYKRMIFDIENLKQPQTLRYDIPKEYSEFLDDDSERIHKKTYMEMRIDNE